MGKIGCSSDSSLRLRQVFGLYFSDIFILFPNRKATQRKNAPRATLLQKQQTERKGTHTLNVCLGGIRIGWRQRRFFERTAHKICDRHYVCPKACTAVEKTVAIKEDLRQLPTLIRTLSFCTASVQKTGNNASRPPIFRARRTAFSRTETQIFSSLSKGSATRQKGSTYPQRHSSPHRFSKTAAPVSCFQGRLRSRRERAFPWNVPSHAWQQCEKNSACPTPCGHHEFSDISFRFRS